MQIRDYARVVIKRWWIFVLVAAIAAGSAYAYSKLQRPVFRASAFLTVAPARPDYGNSLFVQGTLRQYGRMLQTADLAQRVSRELQLDLTAEQLQAKVKVSPVQEDLLLQIDVDDHDPGLAQRIARSLAEAFVEDQQKRMASIDPRDRVSVELLDEPKPGRLDRPKTSVNVLAATVLGVVLAAIIAFGLEFLDDTIKDAADVERYVATAVIGSIPTIRSRRSDGAAAQARLGDLTPSPPSLKGRG